MVAAEMGQQKFEVEPPKTSVLVEPATVADAADILALQRLVYRSHAELYKDLTIPAITRTYFEIKAEFSRRVFLKAVDGGRIVGAIQGFQVGMTCYVGQLMVHPERSREGIGTHLMAAIEEAFSGVERFEVFAGHKSKAYAGLYTYLGYAPFKTENMNDKLTLVFMEKWRSK